MESGQTMSTVVARSPQPRSGEVKKAKSSSPGGKCPPSEPATLPPLHVRVWKRLCAICETIHNILKITWLMLVIMYRYPNASRGAAMISYRALLLSYQYQLWSLSGLCGYGGEPTNAKQQLKAAPKPVEEVRKEVEASLRGEMPKEVEESSTKTAKAPESETASSKKKKE